MKTNSKSLSNKLKANTPMSLRSRQISQKNQATPTTPTTTDTKNEELVDIIRKVVKEELQSHEETFSEIIKSHLETTNQRLNQISGEVIELTKSLEFTQGEVKDEITNLKNDINEVKKELQEIGEDVLDPDFVTNKLVELEDRSRRNNIRIDGIEEDENETWESCEDKVQQLIKENLGIESNVEIERCHRMKKNQKNQTNNDRRPRPRTIVCKLLRFKDKQKIIQSSKRLKNSGIFVYEDFCKDTMDLRKQLWEKVLDYRAQNKIAYLNYRSIVVKNQRNVYG